MKRLLFYIAIAAFPIFIFGQKPGHSTSSLRLFENSRPFTLPDGEGNNLEIPLETIEGSPYLTEEFYPGKVYSNNQNTGTFLIRYNIYNDVMEVKLKDDVIQEVIVNPEVKIAIGTSRFEVHDFMDRYNNLVMGYFEILEDGENIDLLLKHNSVFTPREPPISGNHKPKKPEFEYSSDYYLFFNNQNRPVKIKKLKEKRILELLNDKKNAKTIIEENNLDLRNEKDLRKLIISLNGTSI